MRHDRKAEFDCHNTPDINTVSAWGQDAITQPTRKPNPCLLANSIHAVYPACRVTGITDIEHVCRHVADNVIGIARAAMQKNNSERDKILDLLCEVLAGLFWSMG